MCTPYTTPFRGALLEQLAQLLQNSLNLLLTTYRNPQTTLTSNLSSSIPHNDPTVFSHSLVDRYRTFITWFAIFNDLSHDKIGVVPT